MKNSIKKMLIETQAKPKNHNLFLEVLAEGGSSTEVWGKYIARGGKVAHNSLLKWSENYREEKAALMKKSIRQLVKMCK